MAHDTISAFKRIRCCCSVGILLGFSIASPCVGATETVIYYYTNQQGTPIATADASGNVLSTADYKPYGTQAVGSPAPGPGYTGHVNDPDSGLVYMQARYYDPVVGRFLGADPGDVKSGDFFGFDRYAYANNNPVNNIDADGRDCRTSNGITHCVTAVYDVSFRAQPGFKDFTSTSLNYHFYSTPVYSVITPVNTARTQLFLFPTPGLNVHPATVAGTPNDATPILGGLWESPINPVMSFKVTNAKDGQPAVVNVTEVGHKLAFGIVVREVVPNPGWDGGSITQSWGEGTAPLQAPGSLFGGIIDGIWNLEGPIETDGVVHCFSQEDSGCW